MKRIIPDQASTRWASLRREAGRGRRIALRRLRLLAMGAPAKSGAWKVLPARSTGLGMRSMRIGMGLMIVLSIVAARSELRASGMMRRGEERAWRRAPGEDA